jgi:hypothetical protein
MSASADQAPEGISTWPSRRLRGNSIWLTLTDVTGCLRIRTPIPEMESPDAAGGWALNGGHAFLVIQAGPLVPQSPVLLGYGQLGSTLEA